MEYIEEFDPVYQYGQKEEIAPAAKRVGLEDARVLTLNKYGYINLEWWAHITGYTPEEIITLARGKLIWRDPAQYKLGADPYAGWLIKEQMLFGNRFKKYKETLELNGETDGLFEDELNLLKKNLPELVDGKEIHVNIGSPWILEIDDFLSKFIKKHLDIPLPPRVFYDDYHGKWDITSMWEPNSYLNYVGYGTNRVPAIDIIKKKLNGTPLNVYDQVPDYDRDRTVSVLNKEETQAAKEKGKLNDEAFRNYCHSEENEELLQEAYMKSFGYGLCRFDG